MTSESRKIQKRIAQRAYLDRHRDAVNARNRERYAQNPSVRLNKNRNWRNRHSDELKERRKSWPSQSSEVKAEQFQRYYTDNAEQRRAASRAWYEANKERRSETRRAYEAANKDRIKECKQRHLAANPEQYAERCARRRAMKRGARVDGRKIDYRSIKASYNGICGICKVPMDITTEPYHYDHIVPLAMGGVHAAHNIQIAHATCNLRKGARVD